MGSTGLLGVRPCSPPTTDKADLGEAAEAGERWVAWCRKELRREGGRAQSEESGTEFRRGRGGGRMLSAPP